MREAYVPIRRSNPMTATQENKLLVRRFLEHVFLERDLDAASEMLTWDYSLHDPSRPDFGGGRTSFEEAYGTNAEAIDYQRLSVEDQIADGDKVVTRWIVSGTQRGDLPGIPNHGKSFMLSGITISRIADGHIAEEWQVWDDAGLTRQLTA
jgi:steroid delta-isomerase-like uncharacterized protein